MYKSMFEDDIDVEEDFSRHISSISETLFVGDIWAATNSKILQQFKITHILCAAYGVEPEYPNEYQYLNIDIFDCETTDLTPHLFSAVHFVEEAILKGGRVLVHCMAGMSRSVSFCCAYLMVKDRHRLDDALALVKKARPIACPNDGFMKQLREFESKAHSYDLKQYFENKKRGEVSSIFRCRKCRHKLLNNTHIVPHSIPDDPDNFYRKRTHGVKDNTAKECSSWFIGDTAWQHSALDDIEGTLCCPRCNTQVGSYCWAGAQCSCGHWITPAIQVLRSRVDEVPSEPVALSVSKPPVPK